MTTRGLMLKHNTDLTNYETFIDGIMDYSLIKHDPKLIELLQSAKADVIVFTNSGIMHTTRALEILGVLPHVHMVVYAKYTDPEFVVKPHQEVYEGVENLLQTDPSNLYFFDDSEENVRAAKERGWNAVQIVESQEDTVVPGYNAIRTIKDVYATFSVFPSLFSE
jgi:pyrimidine 5'-nucleotidase